jgi:hypothetical protein
LQIEGRDLPAALIEDVVVGGAVLSHCVRLSCLNSATGVTGVDVGIGAISA